MTPAERLLVGLGIAEPKDIDLDAIAWTQGAVVNYRPIDNCEATIFEAPHFGGVQGVGR
ncbi:hypothetical protein [Bradyrhizobium canariense]|uniref:hypothetical protein n=1 Tax=Bradyrhizobium canariense TaxID=255045 RepID=UPI001FCCC31B|nr:hypothetical protein [Bradyrhizobium canariense]